MIGWRALSRDNLSPRAAVMLDLLKFLAVMSGLVWLAIRSGQALSYNWQWYRVGRYLWTFEDGRFVAGPLLEGLWVTLEISGLSLLLTFAWALVVALMRLSNSWTARVLARGYLELIRNTPLLIQLFFIYFVIAPVIEMSPYASAVVALTLFEGAYASEMIRAGIVSIDRGQWEASASLGMTTTATYRYIILPQAIRRVLPPLTSQAVSLVKDSALVSTIAIYDLTMKGMAIVAETYLTFEIWFTVAIIYLILTVSLSILVQILERRMAVEG